MGLTSNKKNFLVELVSGFHLKSVKPAEAEMRSHALEFKFACLHCGQHLSATLSDVGVVSSCPTCFQDVTVPLPSQTGPDAPRESRNSRGSAWTAKVLKSGEKGHLNERSGGRKSACASRSWPCSTTPKGSMRESRYGLGVSSSCAPRRRSDVGLGERATAMV